VIAWPPGLCYAMLRRWLIRFGLCVQSRLRSRRVSTGTKADIVIYDEQSRDILSIVNNVERGMRWRETSCDVVRCVIYDSKQDTYLCMRTSIRKTTVSKTCSGVEADCT